MANKEPSVSVFFLIPSVNRYSCTVTWPFILFHCASCYVSVVKDGSLCTWYRLSDISSHIAQVASQLGTVLVQTRRYFLMLGNIYFFIFPFYGTPINSATLGVTLFGFVAGTYQLTRFAYIIFVLVDICMKVCVKLWTVTFRVWKLDACFWCLCLSGVSAAAAADCWQDVVRTSGCWTRSQTSAGCWSSSLWSERSYIHRYKDKSCSSKKKKSLTMSSPVKHVASVLIFRLLLY